MTQRTDAEIIQKIQNQCETTVRQEYASAIQHARQIVSCANRVVATLSTVTPEPMLTTLADAIGHVHRYQAHKEILDTILALKGLPYECYCSEDLGLLPGRACTYCNRFGRDSQTEPEV